MSCAQKQLESARRYRERHPERVKQIKKRWVARNPEKVRAQKERERLRNGEKIRERVRQWGRKRAGLPPAARPCPAACELCGAAPTRKALHLDHDHVTGAFRGWLCTKCNAALGFANDSPALLRAMAAYLERNGAVLS
jgi:hypothetical protein